MNPLPSTAFSPCLSRFRSWNTILAARRVPSRELSQKHSNNLLKLQFLNIRSGDGAADAAALDDEPVSHSPPGSETNVSVSPALKGS